MDSNIITKKNFFKLVFFSYIILILIVLIIIPNINFILTSGMIIVMLSAFTLIVFIEYNGLLASWRFNNFKDYLYIKDEDITVIDSGYMSNKIVAHVKEHDYENDSFIIMEYNATFKPYNDNVENVTVTVHDTSNNKQTRLKEQQKDELKRKKLRHEVAGYTEK